MLESPGARTTGGKAANFLLTGPGWSGEVPAGMREIKSPPSTPTYAGPSGNGRTRVLNGELEDVFRRQWPAFRPFSQTAAAAENRSFA